MEINNDYFVNVVKEILVNRFPDGPKRNMIVRPDSIQFACPICGDSEKNIHKKRAKFFFDSLQMHCYHMGCHASLTKLSKLYNIEIDADKKLAIYQYIDSKIQLRKQHDDEFIINDMKLLMTIDEIIDTYNMSPSSYLKGITRIEKGSKVYNYLQSRLLPDSSMELFYEAMLKVTDNIWEPCLLYFNFIRDKCIGLQIRNLKSGKKRRYKIVNFSEIYELVHNEPMDEIEAIPYNKLSYFYNIFNVNYNSTITVFEAYIDSLFCPNSVGVVGTNTDLGLFLNNDISVRFFFDNDYAGKLQSIKLIKEGKSVFLWDKFLDEWASKKGDYYENKISLATIKDLNKLVEITKSANAFIKFNLDDYFSKDIYDIKYIRLPKKEKYVPSKLKSLLPLKEDNIDWDFITTQITSTGTLR